MSIVRAPRPETYYYVLDKRISEDKRLSWAARGLLVYLLGKPDNWTVSVAQLIDETKESDQASGRDKVYALLKALEDAGYVVKMQARTNGGGFASVEYVVRENPLTEKPEPPHTDLPDTALPLTANPTLTNTDLKQEKKENKKRESEPIVLPDWLPKKSWDDYLSHRRAIRKPVSKVAESRLLQALEKIREQGYDPVASLDQSIANGWTGVFPPKGDYAKPAANEQSPLSKVGQRNAANIQRWLEETTQ